MSRSALRSNEADWVLMTWVFVWSLVFVVAIGGLVGGVKIDDLNQQSKFVLGSAAGGLSAAWVVIGTWLILIDLPCPKNPERQRFKARIWVMLATLLIVSLFVAVTHNAPIVLGTVLMMVCLTVAGPLIIWQWTHCRIRRVGTDVSQRRSIRQILSITVTVAVAIAGVNVALRRFELPPPFAGLAMFSSLIWLVLTVTMLGRYWPAMLATLPILLAQWVVLTQWVDLRDRDAVDAIRLMNGVSTGFPVFAVLFLALMRSSGHRWMQTA